jgi:hypothetical protein
MAIGLDAVLGKFVASWGFLKFMATPFGLGFGALEEEGTCMCTSVDVPLFCLWCRFRRRTDTRKNKSGSSDLQVERFFQL